MIKYLTLFLLISLSFSFYISRQKHTSKDVPPYSEDRSKFLADLSGIAYCKHEAVSKWSCGLCKKHSNLINITNIVDSYAAIYAYVLYNTDTKEIILTWRGSIDSKNYFEDLNFEVTPYSSCKGCKIHLGFYRDYKLVQKKVHAAIDALFKLYPDSTIVTTGHSLGGALSEISAMELFKVYGARVKECHNFGAPRIGNAELAHYLHSKVPTIFRIVHDKDFAPHLPPIELKYLHPPFEVLYTQDFDSYKVCDESGEDKTCADRFTGYNWDDHHKYFVAMNDTIC